MKAENVLPDFDEDNKINVPRLTGGESGFTMFGKTAILELLSAFLCYNMSGKLQSNRNVYQ